jgi:hypothetical protein
MVSSSLHVLRSCHSGGGDSMKECFQCGQMLAEYTKDGVSSTESEEIQ